MFLNKKDLINFLGNEIPDDEYCEVTMEMIQPNVHISQNPYDERLTIQEYKTNIMAILKWKK